MTELTIEQAIYLLYAKAYSEDAEAETVTNGTVKSHLPGEWKEKAGKIYDALKTRKLIELRTKEGQVTTRQGRFFITEQGRKALVSALATTNYEFTSSKGYRVLNALLSCLKETVITYPQDALSEEITFDEFQEKFKALYFEERRQQELRGVVAIHSQELLTKFAKQSSISLQTLNKHFEQLKTNGKIFAVIEKGNELIQWVE